MRRFVVLVAAVFLLWIQASSQQTGAGHTSQASCVILKRMGPADEITSHLYSFGIRGKQFQYIEGKLPEGVSFHGRLTDHDVRTLESHGANVIVLEPHYTADDLANARAGCGGEKQSTPTLQVAKEKTAAEQDAKSAQTALEITSSPSGAEIELDGSFIGNTPSTIKVEQGEHSLKLTKSGYNEWERKIKTTSGNVKISPELVPTVEKSK